MLKVARIILICTTAIVSPTYAEAAPVVAAIKGVGAWLTATFGATLGGVIGNIGASLILSAISRALAGKPKQQSLIRELTRPTSLPVYRFVYGYTRAPGTPAPVKVKGAILYGCYILNSRQSAGPFTLYLDKRDVQFTGDPYDFSGAGAVASNAPFAGHVNYWIGRGDQFSPPAQILSEAPELFLDTDGWRGMTVIWVRLNAGANKDRSTRWPAAPPEVMVDGYWSLVRDPRAPNDDPAWSANYALCALDALRENPLRPYDDRNLWLETFAWAADEADIGYPVKAGGNEPLECNGVLAFSDGAELEDQVLPIVACGAGKITRSGGILGLVPAVYQDPVVTLTDVLGDDPMSFSRYRPSAELATEVSATYTSPDRAYEDAETPAYILDGAQAEDGRRNPVQYELGMVTDHRQAQWVAAINGRRTRMQRSVSAVFPATAFDLVAGSPATLALPAPYDRRNGVYEVEDANPGGDPVGLDGFAMRVAMTLRETSPAIYAWDPEVDEQDVAVEDFDPNISGVQPPGAITLTSDATTVLISGDTSIARIMFTFGPSTSVTVLAYESQIEHQSGDWQSGGTIEANVLNGSGDVFGYVVPVVIGDNYRVRVRSLTSSGASGWTTSDPTPASAGSYLSDPPTPISVVPEPDQIAVTFQAPNDPDYRAMEIWGSDTNSSGTATLLFGPIYGAANDVVTRIEAGLPASHTRYYFGVSRDRNGEPSPFSASISGTTP